jgi:solute carrier family 25 phosphate transporter 23/24/25/41
VLGPLEEKVTVAEASSIISSEKFQKTVAQLSCGGIAGAVSRTVVAPIDRVKILLQTQYLLHGEKAKYTSIMQTCRTIVVEEGVTRLWRGNVTNMVRVFPYAATQFTSYEKFKVALLRGNDRKLTVVERLSAGALAGMTATTITHPLDLIRLRLSVDPNLRNAADACRSIMAEGGPKMFFKGYVPTLLSLSPFIAINFATFDTLKTSIYPDGKTTTLGVLGLGAASGIFAQTCCFPLDTVRRRMQLKGKMYEGTIDAFRTIMRVEGAAGFYKGMLPNAIKVIPNNAVRFLVFDFLSKNKSSPFYAYTSK